MFVVIGERINTSRAAMKAAVEVRDADAIRLEATKQEAAGAAYLDVNAGARYGHEAEDMRWLLEVIQPVVGIPLCLDSPDPAVLDMAFGLVEKRPMVNSISLESERYQTMLPFLEGKDCAVIALCMDDTGLPLSADDVVDRAARLAAGLEGIGVARDAIYVDPLIQPIATDQSKGLMVLDAVARIRAELPGIHFTCGLSNISYGLPQRRLVNRMFLGLLMAAGLDGAIIDPLDEALMGSMTATDMLLGNDEFCSAFLTGVRAGRVVS